jgi:uncharacterized protein
MPIDFARTIAGELAIRPNQVARSIELFDDDNTMPFVARYRKEVTGGLDEAQLRTILERLTYLRNLEARKETVLKSIEEQGKLTDELRARIEGATTLQEVEDLYLPYKPKRRTRATIARERGLEPLAQTMLAQELTQGDLDEIAAPFLNDEVPTSDDAYAGARDIIAETVAEDADVRAAVRERTRKEAWLAASVGDEEKDERGVYQMYYDYREKLSAIPPHRLLAVNRGEREGILKVKLEGPDEELVRRIQAHMITNPRSVFSDHIRAAVADGYQRLLAPSIERELRGESTDVSDEHAIQTFAANLRQLLLQPPVKGKTVIGVDPGYRTGCKVALVDATGKFLGGTTIYPHEPKKQWDEAKAMLIQLITQQGVEVIAIGNGTASRETEQLAAEVISEVRSQKSEVRDLAYVIVSEAGASVYSASDLARKEFPELDVSMRGAIYRAPPARPAGRAGENRPQVHRRRPLPARRESEAVGRDIGHSGGKRRQPRGGGRQHGQRGATQLRGRGQPPGGGCHRQASGATWSLPPPRRAEQGKRPGGEDLPAGGWLFEDP